MKKEKLSQVLEALVTWRGKNEAIALLQAELDRPEPKPVAKVYFFGGVSHASMLVPSTSVQEGQLLYKDAR